MQHMTLLVAELELGDVGLAVQVRCCQGGVQAAIGDITLIYKGYLLNGLWTCQLSVQCV